MTNARTLQPEDRIAQYRVVGPLGAGGMGEVYLAQDQSLERNVALKVLPPDLTRSDERVRRFVQEAKSASSLNHPNIVTIYEIGQEPVKSASGGGDSGPLHYISMELITGKTLGAKIHEEKTDLRTLLGYLAQAAEGIAKAHAAGIIHRDLKPGNIMVSDDGFAKVLDFGLAKLVERFATAGPNEATEVAERTSEGAVMGTVHYMSPEQVQGKAVDARSDVFSFGCILYEAATRQRPFAAESNVETMHKILHEKPRPIEELNATVPAELRRLIRRCLAKSPEQRVQSMKDLAIELREIADEYDTLSASTTSATGSTPAIPAAKRRAPLGPVVVVMSVVAVAAIVFAWWSLRRGEEGAGRPFQTMRVSTQTNRGDVIDCAISPDGRYIAYVAGKTNQNTLRVRQVATGSDVEVLPVQDATMEFPTFSPDGNYLFYCKRKADAPNYRVLMSVPSLGGNEQQRGFDVDSRLAFSPDGKRACYVRGYPQKGYSALMLLDLATGKERELATVRQPAQPGGAPSWSPDGRTIALAAFFPPPAVKTTIAMFDPGSGARRDFFTREAGFFRNLAWLPDGRGLALSGFDLKTTLSSQVFLLTYPGGKFERVTNDFSNYGAVSVGAGDEAIASNRGSQLSNLYVIDVGGGAPRAITANASPERSPTGIATLGDRVYFQAIHDEFLGAWSVPLAGGEPTPLETGNGLVTSLKVGGDRLIFQRVDADQQVHVWRMEPDGSGLRQLTTEGRENLLDLSPDGSMFTFGRADSTRGIWIKSTDGGEPTLISAAVLNAAGVFSADGRFVVGIDFESDERGLIRNVFKVFPVEGGDAVGSIRLPPRASDFEAIPGKLTMTFLDAADPASNVYEMESAGEKVVRVTAFKDGRVVDHEWSPDGRYLAVARQFADGGNVWLTSMAGGQPRQVTSFMGLDVLQITWTPDGRRIVANVGKASSDVALIRSFR